MIHFIAYKINQIYHSQKNAIKSKRKSLTENFNSKINDSLNYKGYVLDLFSENKKVEILNYGINSVKNVKEDIKVKRRAKQIATTNINKHIIAFHDKFALGLMCIVLFFVGAPLGALIRKGGIGLPMVIAILIFLTYHFISIFAKNSSEDNSLDPVFATWLGGLIMLPFSVYLTSRATKDRALIDLDAILIPMKKLVKPITLIDNKKVNNNIDFDKKIQHIDNSKLLN